jgi:oligopeptide/dipeptide ABC transporter ATP-binding protein
VTAEPALLLHDVSVAYRKSSESVLAVDRVSLTLGAGRSLGIVGESGSGKSTLANLVLGLLPQGTSVTGSNLAVYGHTLLPWQQADFAAIRGRAAAMIFQDPLSALHPTLKVGRQMEETILCVRGRGRGSSHAERVGLLAAVGLPDPERILGSYPYELSGGMRQRVLIALALAVRPRLIVADEPTTALDPTTEAQIIALLHRTRIDLGASLLLISHNLGMVASMCDDIAVMYAGRVVEGGPTAEVLSRPQHPYLRALLACDPTLVAFGESGDFPSISGETPVFRDPCPGCAFSPRCSERLALCEQLLPPHVTSGTGHYVACHRNLDFVEADR